MPYLLVRHKVADFSHWKRVFDSHSAAQRRAGLEITHVMHNADALNEIVLLFEADDLQNARQFVYSPDVPRAKEESGVIDKPDIYFLIS